MIRGIAGISGIAGFDPLRYLLDFNSFAIPGYCFSIDEDPDLGSETIRIAFAFENKRFVSLACMPINDDQTGSSKRYLVPSADRGDLFIKSRILPAGVIFSR